ncbi:MAG: MmcQ/YjbR family DNA-binding protein [Planctomycetes bacterium]|nr:MmcQ/YjbR family DNA-binding protein [Planctomycetota bacterium]
MNLETVRRFALSLPLANEEPHFEMSSFRVKGKIFATVPPDGKHLHIFVDEDATAAAVAKHPKCCEELWWGMKLSGVRVTLKNAEAKLVKGLLEASWRRKAPKSAVAEALKRE